MLESSLLLQYQNVEFASSLEETDTDSERGVWILCTGFSGLDVLPKSVCKQARIVENTWNDPLPGSFLSAEFLSFISERIGSWWSLHRILPAGQLLSVFKMVVTNL